MEQETILGVDLGWVSQLESIGYRWIGKDGNQIDPVRGAKELGANTVRLRVFVEPPAYSFWVKPERIIQGHKIEGGLVMLGFCDKEGVVEMAKRVKAEGMHLMIDFHYSDHFADPIFQDTPTAWIDLSLENLKQRLADHTREVLLALGEAKISPEYVQVGNEINGGLLLPVGSRVDHPGAMTALLNEGYMAVKEICPNACVITHISAGHMAERIKDFFDVFFRYGGKTDMIGLSYYPAWFGLESDPEEFLQVLNQAISWYGKPIMLSEIGGPDDEEEQTYRLLRDTLALVDRVKDHALKGMVYWEPETNRAVMPDAYPLGASRLVGKKNLQYTEVLRAYRDFKEEKNI